MHNIGLYLLVSALTVGVYAVSLFIYKKGRSPLLNPILLSLLMIAGIVRITPLNWESYIRGSKPIIALLPLTIILLALPLYRKFHLLCRYYRAILAGVTAGVATSAVSIFLMGKLFGIDAALIRSLLPKSITTPLGLALSDLLNGMIGVSVLAIVITGMLGVVVYAPVFKLFSINEPIARGVALGTASHAVGTSKAIELGEEEGAMSSLALVITGIITLLASPLLLVLIMIY